MKKSDNFADKHRWIAKIFYLDYLFELYAAVSRIGSRIVLNRMIFWLFILSALSVPDRLNRILGDQIPRVIQAPILWYVLLLMIIYCYPVVLRRSNYRYRLPAGASSVLFFSFSIFLLDIIWTIVFSDGSGFAGSYWFESYYLWIFVCIVMLDILRFIGFSHQKVLKELINVTALIAIIILLLEISPFKFGFINYKFVFDSTYLAYLCAIGVALLLFERDHGYRGAKKIVLIFLFSVGLLMQNIFGAELLLLVLLTLYIFVSKIRLYYRIAIFSAIVIFVFYSSFLLYFYDTVAVLFVDNKSDLVSGQSLSSYSRLYSFINSGILYLENPIYGIGMSQLQKEVSAGAGMHMHILYPIFSYGLFGLLFVFYIVAKFIGIMWRHSSYRGMHYIMILFVTSFLLTELEYYMSVILYVASQNVRKVTTNPLATRNEYTL